MESSGVIGCMYKSSVGSERAKLEDGVNPYVLKVFKKKIDFKFKLILAKLILNYILFFNQTKLLTRHKCVFQH